METKTKVYGEYALKAADVILEGMITRERAYEYGLYCEADEDLFRAMVGKINLLGHGIRYFSQLVRRRYPGITSILMTYLPRFSCHMTRSLLLVALFSDEAAFRQERDGLVLRLLTEYLADDEANRLCAVDKANREEVEHRFDLALARSSARIVPKALAALLSRPLVAVRLPLTFASLGKSREEVCIKCLLAHAGAEGDSEVKRMALYALGMSPIAGVTTLLRQADEGDGSALSAFCQLITRHRLGSPMTRGMTFAHVDRVLSVIRAVLYGALGGMILGRIGEGYEQAVLSRRPVTSFDEAPAEEGYGGDGALLLMGLAIGVYAPYNLPALMEGMIACVKKGVLTVSGRGFDPGVETLLAMERFSMGEPIKSCGVMRESGGERVALRLIGSLLGTMVTDDMLYDAFVCDAASLTHREEAVRVFCGIYASVFRALVLYPEEEAALARGLGAARDSYGTLASFSRFRGLYEGGVKEERAAGLEELLGEVFDCVRAGGNVSECLLRAVNLGGRSEIRCGLVGALAGARYGMDERLRGLISRMAGKEIADTVLTQAVLYWRKQMM